MRLVQRIGCALGALALACVPATASTAQAPAAVAAPKPTNKERVVPLEGGQNFRDLGGYRSSDGRSVKWGLIYRSGSMHGLTNGDFEKMRALGIRSVVDFRSNDERVRDPLKVPEGYSLAV